VNLEATVEILIVNFTLDGMTETEYRSLCDTIAPAFAAVPGLISKVWLADSSAGVYGGVYTFQSHAALEAYVDSDLFSQAGATPGLSEFSVRRFEVLAAPTGVTRGLAMAEA
jgi:Putative mono-oxygenase ydhR